MPAYSRFRAFHYYTLPLFSTFITRFHHSFHEISKFQPRFPNHLQPNFLSNESELVRCVANGNHHYARQLLDKIPQRRNQSQVVAWTSLLTELSRQGLIDEARILFDIMPKRNLVTYNAMLSGYVRSGRLSEALFFFDEMPEKNVVSRTSLLFGLLNGGMLEEGKRLFDVLPERNIVTWNSMILGLVNNGDLKGARNIFDVMPVKNVISWNVMIDGYARNSMMGEARALFDIMETRNVVTWTSLITGYSRDLDLENAYQTFVRMPYKNVVSWTAMISGFARNSFYQEALMLFLEMRNSDVRPNEETFVSVAYSCAGVGSFRLGMQLHGHLIVNGLQDYHHDFAGRISNSLICMYSKLGLLNYAQFIFWSNTRVWTLESCNSMISVYVKIREMEKARYIFDAMRFNDKVSCTSMISGYFSIGQVDNAYELFNRMPDRDAIAWTTMISGHVQNELFLEAINLFVEMRFWGISPLQSTYSSLLGAAGAMANLDHGRQLHCLLMKTQPSWDLVLHNSLISMYGKCGEVVDAYNIFSTMSSRDLISWNSMIMGYANYGLAPKSLALFEDMVKTGTKPDSVTFLGLLSACNHAGMISQGEEIYKAMGEIYGIEPSAEHSISMINLLGRAGRIEEAEHFVLSLSTTKQDVRVWGALLGVCGLGEINAEIARRTANRVIELDPRNSAAQIVLCNIHAGTAQFREEEHLRKEFRMSKMMKVPGWSWISQKEGLDVFCAGAGPGH